MGSAEERDAASAARDEAEQEAARSRALRRLHEPALRGGGPEGPSSSRPRSGRRVASKQSSRRPRPTSRPRPGPRTTPRRRGARSRRTSASPRRPRRAAEASSPRRCARSRRSSGRAPGRRRGFGSSRADGDARAARLAALEASMTPPPPPDSPRQSGLRPGVLREIAINVVTLMTQQHRARRTPSASLWTGITKNGCSIMHSDLIDAQNNRPPTRRRRPTSAPSSSRPWSGRTVTKTTTLVSPADSVACTSAPRASR